MALTDQERVIVDAYGSIASQARIIILNDLVNWSSKMPFNSAERAGVTLAVHRFMWMWGAVQRDVARAPKGKTKT